MERMAQRYYDKEGDVVLTLPKPCFADYVVGGLFGACILASVFLWDIPPKYMEPVSALYVVPFLIYMTWRRRRISGWFPSLWAAFFALHAILIVMGAPIWFEGKWESLNILVPIVGYGLLVGLIGHAYNRYSLNRLKAFAMEKE